MDWICISVESERLEGIFWVLGFGVRGGVVFDALDDDIDAADVFHGHFGDFIADIFLDLEGDFG